jgi:hypothetical protein|tara:strand:- start:1603 stop:1725 length:123 start_codon:yes stop_codon:yes gene_type:complete
MKWIFLWHTKINATLVLVAAVALLKPEHGVRIIMERKRIA